VDPLPVDKENHVGDEDLLQVPSWQDDPICQDSPMLTLGTVVLDESKRREETNDLGGMDKEMMRIMVLHMMDDYLTRVSYRPTWVQELLICFEKLGRSWEAYTNSQSVQMSTLVGNTTTLTMGIGAMVQSGTGPTSRIPGSGERRRHKRLNKGEEQPPRKVAAVVVCPDDSAHITQLTGTGTYVPMYPMSTNHCPLEWICILLDKKWCTELSPRSGVCVAAPMRSHQMAVDVDLTAMTG